MPGDSLDMESKSMALTLHSRFIVPVNDRLQACALHAVTPLLPAATVTHPPTDDGRIRPMAAVSDS